LLEEHVNIFLVKFYVLTFFQAGLVLSELCGGSCSSCEWLLWEQVAVEGSEVRGVQNLLETLSQIFLYLFGKGLVW